MTTPADIEIGSKNVYADLGRADAKDMLIKARLTAQIASILDSRDLTQRQAAALVGLTQPKLSNILRGQFRGVSETKLLECLRALGNDVRITVKPTARGRATGEYSVIFAE